MQPRLFRVHSLAFSITLLLAAGSAVADLGCPAGFVPDGNETLVDNSFSNGYASFTTAIPQQFTPGTYPQDGNTTSYPNTAIGLITGDISFGAEVQQSAFPGDPNPGSGLPPVAAANTWLAYNGTDAGAPSKIWEQSLTGLTPNTDYAFSAYFSNALAPGYQATDYAAPQVIVKVDNVDIGTPIVVCDSGNTTIDPVDGSCTVEATADVWTRHTVSINSGNKTSLALSVHDAHAFDGAGGNDFAMTLISFQQCVPVGTPDIDTAATTVPFPTYSLGGTAVSKTITISNAGTGMLVIGNIAAPANADFTVVADNCSSQSLTAAATCTIDLQFSTATEGEKTTTLAIPSNDPDENPLTLTLKAQASNNAGIDSDGDGIVDSADLDDDNDGIPDSVEGDGDFDGDGIPDRLDLDADNDSIPDVREALGNDNDNNGRIDNFVDSNGDGLHDPLATTPLPTPDTDGDGRKDFRDLDSDNDGNFDLAEVNGTDADGNGIVDSFSDGDNDGWDRAKFAAVLGDNGALQDTDGNGTPDYRQGLGEIRTRLDGGIGGFGLPFALMLLPLATRRRRLLAAAALLSASSLALAEEGQFYIGGGVGISQLEPDIVNLPLTVSDDSDTAYKLLLGYDLRDWLSIEGFGAKMGSAGISDGGTIDYNSYGVGIVVNLPNNVSGLSALAKMGYGQIDNDSSDVAYREMEDHEAYAGVGVEYQFDNDISLRGEYEYIDKDAKMFTISLLKRFGGETEAVPAPVVVVAPAPVVAVIQEPAPTPPPLSVITLEMAPIHFDNDSTTLTPAARAKLDEIAQTLRSHPEVTLRIIGHTDSRASDTYNQALSERRAAAAAEYLVGKGIARSRLHLEGHGEREPVADNGTKAGRAANRRVEFEPTPREVEATMPATNP